MAFIHLHLHTEYSLLDGATRIDELFNHIKDLGMNAVAITEHGNMGAVIRKYQAAKKAGVKLILGFEAYITEDMTKKERGKDFHLILLAKNFEGYQNLIKLVSIANSEGFYYRPRIDRKILRKYSKGVICMSACIANDISRAILNGDENLAKEIVKEYVDIFGKDDFYLEVQNHGIEEEGKVREVYKEFAKEFGLKIVATTDSHYLKKEDSRAHEIMLAVQTNSFMDDPNRMTFDGEGYHVLSENEVRALFPENPEYVDITSEISDKCNVDFSMGKPIFPHFEVPDGKTHRDYLYDLCMQGLDDKYKNKDNYEEALKRMNFELSVIEKMGFETYFLIVADFINHAKKYCQVGPGRGSGPGSIVAYCLGITQLEPLGLGLLFERFLNPDRISLPDFDIDFGDKDVALDYVRKKYGHDKVAMIGTYGTMGAKAVLKDVMRVFRVPFDEANEITKLVLDNSIEKSINYKNGGGGLTEEAKKLRDYSEKYHEIFNVARRLEGCVRHKGVHACGVVWGQQSITDYIPTYCRKGDIVTQVEGGDIETYGLVKFDFLGLETLNIIKKVLDKIGKDGEWLENIPLDDDLVYKMLRESKSIGVFQIESEGMRKTLSLVQPTCFDDIIALVALYRPGPMQYLSVYADRKHGREVVTYPHEKSTEILSPTYGIMVYQEQVMKLSRVLAGFSPGESDTLRKAIGKKKLDLMMQMEKKFKEGCVNLSGMNERDVKKLWEDIVKFASYSFNKSHAAAYALIAYRTAYLKAYYPVEFYAAIISSSVGDPDKLAFYLNAAREEGIRILSPNINTSEKGFSVEKIDGEEVIRVGLNGVKNIGDEALKSILENRPYESYQDFINKVDLSKVNKRVCFNLISVGCFDEFGVNRSSLLAIYDKIVKESEKKEKQLNLFGEVANIVKYPDLPQMPLKHMLDIEKELLGACVSGHPVEVYAESRSRYFIPYPKLVKERDADVFGLVKRYTQIITRSGDPMAFMEIYNKEGNLRVTIFPNVFKEELKGKQIGEEMGVRIMGKLIEDKEYGDSFIAQKVRICRPLEF
jgi:DNA polymerase III subunit alpha